MRTAELNRVQHGHANSDTEAVAAGVDEREDEEYRRGHGDGIAWAQGYATLDELRDFVAAADATDDTPHWRGFVAGAEEILEEVRAR